MVNPSTGKLLAVLQVLTLAGCGQGEDVPPDAPATVPAPGVSAELAADRRARLSDIVYALQLDIPADADAGIDGQIAIMFDLDDRGGPLLLDFRESPDRILTVEANGRASAWTFVNEHIVVPPDHLEAGNNRIDIEFRAGSTSLNRNPEYLYTLFVPDRARTAFPVFDQPDLKARFDLTLDLPPGWTALGNAPVASVETLGDRSRVRFERTEPIPTYLFSFVAGRFETITRSVGGRELTMLHRETDAAKVSRNVDEIFRLHGAALDWLEDYTGIDYPFAKFGFALIPAFQYGGMEHVGAIQYRAASLFLDEAPSVQQRLGRAGLIAHETAHMWFGNLVTMAWFDDVWTKEVFANFMAAKIVNPSFPEVNHDLNFLVRHYPAAYDVDRTAGANPIRQALPNLNEAGQMYGAIIYNKAPIMMRQLEALIGEAAFRDGLREYLDTFAYGNATWPDLIDILDARTEVDLAAWSEVWVNTPGRPHFVPGTGGTDYAELVQTDPGGLGRVWPQRFSVAVQTETDQATREVEVRNGAVPIPVGTLSDFEVVLNADGYGYGLFPVEIGALRFRDAYDDVALASLLINLYENFLAGRLAEPADRYVEMLLDVAVTEPNQLVSGLAIDQLSQVYWQFLPDDIRETMAAEVENALWQAMLDAEETSLRKVYFDAFVATMSTPRAAALAWGAWTGEQPVADLPLAENEMIELARALAIRLPGQADEIVLRQISNTRNPDNVRKLEFLAPSLSPDPAVRDAFFASLADESMRETERWALDGLENLHHPQRRAHAERYIRPSLELLQEIQVTGDIFFPKRWLDATLGYHRSEAAAATVRTFLDERPDYNKQLRMKILQSADRLFRASDGSAAGRAR